MADLRRMLRPQGISHSTCSWKTSKASLSLISMYIIDLRLHINSFFGFMKNEISLKMFLAFSDTVAEHVVQKRNYVSTEEWL